MSLLETQRFLARLYRDKNLRERFLRAPLEVGAENDLSETESRQLAQVLPEQIRFFSDSLAHKRLHEVEKLLPLARKVLAADFKKYFDEFAPDFQPASIKKHLADAIAFAGFLEKKQFQFKWAPDLIRFERARLEFNGYGRRFVWQTFRFDIRTVLTEISRSEAAPENFARIERRRAVAVWFRWSENGRARHFVRSVGFVAK